MDAQPIEHVAFWVINGVTVAGLAGLIATGALREKILAAGSKRHVGLPPIGYSIAAVSVCIYTVLMLGLGGIGSQAGNLVIGLMPFALTGLMIGVLMRYEQGFALIGLRPTKPLRDLRWAVGAAIIGIAFAATSGYGINALLILLDMEPPSVVHQSLQTLRDDYSLELLLSIIVGAVILAPLFEEIIFRGILQTSLLNMLNHHRWLTLLITSTIFAITHWWVVSWHGMVPLFIIGLVFGYVYERTGSLLTPIVTHMLFNGFNIAIAVATMPAAD